MLVLTLPCPYCRRCRVRVAVDPDAVAVRPNPPPHGRCHHLVYLEGEYAFWQALPGCGAEWPRTTAFAWYHPAFTALDPRGELRHGILTGMVNLYPCRTVFGPAEPFAVALAAVGRSHGEPAADHDLHACGLFAPDVSACVQGILAVDPRHRSG
jgi:hypothetical protein